MCIEFPAKNDSGLLLYGRLLGSYAFFLLVCARWVLVLAVSRKMIALGEGTIK